MSETIGEAEMATKNLTQAEFDDLADAKGITLIDFWAEWCVPCHMFAPVFEKVSNKHLDITFAKVDTEAEIELAAALGINSIPTIMAIRDGVLVHRQAGALPERLLENLIKAVRELDMDEVRASAEAA
jgi:thioredoxin 1